MPHSQPHRTIAQLRGVTRAFPPATVALTEATFSIAAGESIAIIGPSGSGKTTLLSLLGLLDVPTAGSYLLEGTNVSELTDNQRTRIRREYLGFIFQAFHLVPHLTVKENVLYGLRAGAFRNANANATRAVETALQRVGLLHRATAYPATLSGGEQQRVAIARAVIKRPRLLLCDEPTGNLDSSNSALVLDTLFSVQHDESALVIVTHDPNVAARCTRRLRVRDGHVSEETT